MRALADESTATDVLNIQPEIHSIFWKAVTNVKLQDDDQVGSGESTGRMPPMVTYAQNFEDVILRRALQDIEHGFYIDIGAFHPVIDNVTCWFYHIGWRGLNVEPNPAFYAELARFRPEDVNLPIAIAGAAGSVRLRLLNGLSTIVDRLGERYAEDNWNVQNAVDVEAITLDTLLELHAGGRTVDFLKIDAEGAEAEILKAARFVNRPRILVIEATEPNSTRLTSDEWEPHLIGCGYQFAYFDGLNRFYVREEDKARLAWFGAPPNVFDNFHITPADHRIDVTSKEPTVGETSAQEDEIAHEEAPAEPSAPQHAVRLPTESDRLLSDRDSLAARCERLVLERDRLVQDAAATKREASGRIAAAEAAHLAAASACDRLERHLGEAEEQIAGLTTQLAAEQAERQALGDERRSHVDALAALETELEERRKAQADAEARLAVKTRRADATIGRLRAAIAEADVGSRRLSAEAEALAVERDRLTLEVARLELKAESGKRKFDRLFQDANATAEAERRLAVLLKGSEREVADLNDRVKTGRMAAEAVAEAAERHAQDMMRLSDELADRERTLVRLRGSFSWWITRPLRYIGRMLRG